MQDRADSRPTVVMLADVDLSGADGSRSHVLEIATALVRARRDVVLVARGDTAPLAGIRVRRSRRLPGRAGRVIGMNVAALTAVIVERRRSRMLYYRFDPGLVGAVLLARLLGYRTVGEINNVMFGPGYPVREPSWRGVAIDSVKVLTMRLATRATHHLFAVTPELRELILRHYSVPARRLRVLGNGVDTERFKPVDRAAACATVGLDPACRYVVFVGLLADWMDLDLIVEAFAAVSTTRPDVRLVVVGDGPRHGELDACVERLRLGDRVLRPGAVSDRSEVAAYLGAATVCVAAYRGQMLDRIGGGSPLKLLEYLAAGRPIVASGGQAVRALVEETGSGVAVTGTDAFAVALAGLLDDPQRGAVMSARGRRAAVEHHSWDAVIRRVIEALEPGDAGTR